MMNKHIRAVIFGLLIAVSPVVVVAQTTDAAAVRAQILNLLAQIRTLQTQLNSLQSCALLTRNVGAGQSLSTAEAAILKSVLVDAGFWDSVATLSTYDEDVAGAVVSFQEKYGIKKTGYVGPVTRARINQLYKCATTQTPVVTDTVPTVTTPVTTTMVPVPSPTSTFVYALATLSSTNEDHAGVWHTFTADGQADNNWTLNLTTYPNPTSSVGTVTISSISLLSDTPGEGWSTNLDTNDLGKGLYPLVVVRDGKQLNTDYNQTIGDPITLGQSVTLRLFGQHVSNFSGGKIIVRLTNGVQVSSRVAVSAVVTPPVPVQQKVTTYIDSITPASALVGTTLEIKGSAMVGYHNDLYFFLRRADGKVVRLPRVEPSQITTNAEGKQTARVTLKEPCQQGETVYGDYSGIPAPCDYVQLTPGVYKVYTAPYGNYSNEVEFTITPAPVVQAPQPTLSLLSPDPAATTDAKWTQGAQQTVTWSTTGISADTPTYVELLDTNGARVALYTTTNTGYFSFIVPTVPNPSGRFYVKVVTKGSSTYSSKWGAFTILVPTVTTTPVTVPAPTPAVSSPTPTTATVSTASTDSLVVSLVDDSSDKAGAWGVFAPGVGASNKATPDWHWVITLKTGATKTVSEMTLSNSGGEAWSTKNSGYFPLVLFRDDAQINKAYGDTFQVGPDYKQVFQVYGQKESVVARAGTLVVKFTDGTSVSASVPAGN